MTFTTLTSGGRVQENSSTRTSSAACALCCTMTSPTNLTGTLMTGGEDQASAQEDRGGK